MAERPKDEFSVTGNASLSTPSASITGTARWNVNPDQIAHDLALLLAGQTGETPIDVTLKALSLYKIAIDAKDEGNGLAIIGPDDRIIQDVTGFGAPGRVADPAAVAE